MALLAHFDGCLPALDHLIAGGEHAGLTSNSLMLISRITLATVGLPGGLIAVDNVLWYGRVIDASFSDPDAWAIRPVRSSENRAVLRPHGTGRSYLRNWYERDEIVIVFS
jgi:hypothetical protein